MDDSWRMRMGMAPSHPRLRRSSDNYTTTVEPDEFADVFGGPPKNFLHRKFSGDFTHSNSFYDEIFKPMDSTSMAPAKAGRSLPGFRIPGKGEGFYGDVFGSWDCHGSGAGSSRRKSRDRSQRNSKEKSNSSSVLSSEEISPRRQMIGDDGSLSSFASKLRPLNIRNQWNRQEQRNNHPFTRARSFNLESESTEEYENFKVPVPSYYGYSKRVSSPESMSIAPSSFRSIKTSTQPNSPASSPVSSICQEPEMYKAYSQTFAYKMEGQNEEEEEEEEDDEDDEAMSSYVIEINADSYCRRDGGSGESLDMDEAIAWAKESSQRQSSNGKPNQSEQRGDTRGTMHFPVMVEVVEEEEEEIWRTEEQKEEIKEQEKKRKVEIEKKQVDEDIRVWSNGKQKNIRLLLSTLNHILWAKSGWTAIPLMNLKESWQVKKGYQKARLCLHPDKLQQRGATLHQNYIAQKAFSILQDAWAEFISEDVFFK